MQFFSIKGVVATAATIASYAAGDICHTMGVQTLRNSKGYCESNPPAYNSFLECYETQSGHGLAWLAGEIAFKIPAFLLVIALIPYCLHKFLEAPVLTQLTGPNEHADTSDTELRI